MASEVSVTDQAATNPTLKTVDLDVDGKVSGKVRDAWQLTNDRRLLVTTDRLSAFDRVIGEVPYKGQVLNQLSVWWFNETSSLVNNHILDEVDPNAVVVKDAKPLPVEVVVRGRLTGSTSTSILPMYAAGERKMYGYDLPDGLAAHGPLPEPLITPTTKAAAGEHDRPITCSEVTELGLVEHELWDEVQRVALELFNRGVKVAANAGFVLADTKYEFGLDSDGSLMLIDELHTPDSSRYWLQETLDQRLAEGLAPESFDKEPVRLKLRELGYRGDGEPPTLPDSVWQETSRRYISLFEAVTSQAFQPGDAPIDERVARNVMPLFER